MSPHHQAWPGAAAKAGTGTLAHLATSLGLAIAAATLIMAAFAGRRLIVSLRQPARGGAHRRAMIRPAVVFGSLVLAAAAASGTAAYLKAHPETVTVTRLVRVPGRSVNAVSAQSSPARSPGPSRVRASAIATAAPSGGHQVGRISLPSRSAPATVSPVPRTPGPKPTRSTRAPGTPSPSPTPSTPPPATPTPTPTATEPGY